ncbi:hypothetical protein BSLG_008424 [Batrachochytrium salamandrivorans]|nr:hypothetical protein BSLG_008424 [Batrachochytrium salamandrivorans]
MSTAFARTALRARAPAQLVRGGHKVSAWGPIHFDKLLCIDLLVPALDSVLFCSCPSYHINWNMHTHAQQFFNIYHYTICRSGCIVNTAIPFGVRNPFIFRTVLWTLSAIFFGLPFYSVERKVWPLRVAAWEAEKAKKDSEDN